MEKICGNCQAMSDLGRCRNGGSRRNLVGYFQSACSLFEILKPKKMEGKTEQAATKRCTKCGRELPVANFNKKASNKDGLQGWCRECQSKAHKEKQAIHKSESAVHEKERAIHKSAHAQGPKKPDQGIGTKVEEVKRLLQIDKFEEFSDFDLINELKDRGYSGTLTKTVRVEL